MAGSGTPIRPTAGISGTTLLMLSLVFLVGIIGAVWNMHKDSVSAQPQPQPRLQRGVVIKTLSDGQLYFVTAVTSEGVDVAPCIGARCTIQEWSAARLQGTVHEDAYPSDPSYAELMALFAKQ